MSNGFKSFKNSYQIFINAVIDPQNVVCIEYTTMSSPISSLKKNKRSPLHSPSRPSPTSDRPPFRHPDFSEDQLQHLTEVNRSVRFIKGLKPFRRPDSSVTFLETLAKPEEKYTHTSGHNDGLLSATEHELMSLLMSRLVQVENRLVETQRELYEKDKKVRVLQEKVKIYEKAKDESVSASTELKHRCIKLQEQVDEMEKFLSDYGMVWVGDKLTGIPTIKENSKKDDDSVEERVVATTSRSWTDGSLQNSTQEFKIDYDQVLENIRVLNMLVEDRVPKLDPSTGATVFTTLEPIPLTLFANGIMLYTGPFRSITEEATQSFVQDLMDGFYPSELQSLYPNGISFQVFDHREMSYRPTFLPFVGEGNSMQGSSKDGSSSPNTNGGQRAKDDYLKRLAYKYTKVQEQNRTHQFLSRLPRVIVREGEIINVRDELSDMLQASPQRQPEIVVVASPVQEIRHHSDDREVCKLRIKSENGTEIYLLKLFTKHTIGDLRKCLDKVRNKTTNTYQIISLCPYEEYDDNNATLEKCGLLHTCALYLRDAKQSDNNNSFR